MDQIVDGISVTVSVSMRTFRFCKGFFHLACGQVVTGCERDCLVVWWTCLSRPIINDRMNPGTHTRKQQISEKSHTCVRCEVSELKNPHHTSVGGKILNLVRHLDRTKLRMVVYACMSCVARMSRIAQILRSHGTKVATSYSVVLLDTDITFTDGGFMREKSAPMSRLWLTDKTQ